MTLTLYKIQEAAEDKIKMAGICGFFQPNQRICHRSIWRSIHGVKCCSGTPNSDSASNNINNNKARTPQFLKFAVSGVTELLRLFSSSDRGRLDRVSYKLKEHILILGIDDIINILKSDYDNAYFVTGIFTSEIYTEDCIFEDPTIRFRGTELYSRNLRLLVPFFEHPSIGLQKIDKGSNSGTNFVLATWKLRTYLKLPWRPFISIEGSTVYELNDEFKIIRHAESWNVSALEAVGQIFTPGDRN